LPLSASSQAGALNALFVSFIALKSSLLRLFS